MLIRRHPTALLALATGRALRVLAIDPLRDPARQLQSTGAGILVNQNAVSESPGRQSAVDFALGRSEPVWRAEGVHEADVKPTASSRAATAASHTWSSGLVASMTRNRLGAARASSR